MTNKKQLVGAHVSIAGGIEKSISEATSINATTMQIFTKSNRSWFAPSLTEQEITSFKTALASSSIKAPVVHASYLINLAAQNPLVKKNSATSLKQELKRCEQLDIPYLVLHPGSHVGAGEEAGINQIASLLNEVLSNAQGNTIIALELMAGQGTNLGYRFEQLKQMIDQTEYAHLLGICLDTCHAFAAGYDLTTEKGYQQMMQEIEETVGIQALKVIHLNDSKEPCNARKDRHESLGMGQIPLPIFTLLMNDKRLISVPKILETPNPDLYADEIAQLIKMVE